MIANLTKKDCIMTISKLPDSFIQQFFKIACYYQGFMASEKHLEDRSTYITRSNLAIMMLNNLLTTASNGVPVENQIAIDKERSLESIAHALAFYESRINHPDEELITKEKPKKKASSNSSKKSKKGDKNGSKNKS